MSKTGPPTNFPDDEEAVSLKEASYIFKVLISLALQKHWTTKSIVENFTEGQYREIYKFGENLNC